MKSIRTLIKEKNEKRRLLRIEENNRYLKDNGFVEVEMKAGDEDCTLAVKENMKDNIPDLLIERINDIQENQPKSKKRHAFLAAISSLLVLAEGYISSGFIRDAIENFDKNVPMAINDSQAISAIAFVLLLLPTTIITENAIISGNNIKISSVQLDVFKKCMETNYPSRMTEINKPSKKRESLYKII